MNKATFVDSLKNLNIELDEKKLQLLQEYCDFLLEYNKHTNLTAIRDEEGVYLKHFYDSLTISKYLDNNINLIDIGTGAGFPGMVIAITRPDINVTLLDSNNKKIKFLEELKNRLHLNNVTTVHERAEVFAHNNIEKFDIVTSRAVAQLRVLVELGIPMLKINGKFIAMKGNLNTELDEALDTISLLNSEVIEKDEFKLIIENSNRINLILKKNKKSDAIYPRAYDKIIKKPLVKNNKK